MPSLTAVEAIFQAALEKGSPEEWAAYLDQACQGDSDLRQQVERLLNAQGRLGSFLEQPAAEGATSEAVSGQWIDPASLPRLSEGPGSRIGPYKLLQQVGEGGMGVVYMAEQEQPVRRKVALKIIKPGMDSSQVIARFEAERQALALMDHQNIARVLDAGTTDSGRPYFVMELVKGVPITKFCDEQHLTPRERLELFVPICQAIQHAHQKGIIHRDVKPSNVLVTLYDGKPVPKVIDFGVAKAIEQRLTERTLFTQLGQVVGTVEYMSPEQAELNALDIDTRSDIYSLGVLLYELLTGTTPLEKQKLRGAAFAEMLRMIREEEPPRPSTRLSGSGDRLPSISAQRKTEPAKLAKLVRGELDWIVMKSLEKDRGRRYETASGFARDIERYLADEPVQACPPSAAYKLRKFARKNRKALVTAGAFLLLLLALGGGVGWVVNERAARQRDAETRVLEALETAEPRLRQGDPRDQALLSAAQRVEAQLGGGDLRPEVRRRGEQFLRDVRMLADLDEARLHRADIKDGGFDVAGAEAQYAAAFRSYGIDVLASDPAEAAARVRASAIHEPLLAGLDDWLAGSDYMSSKGERESLLMCLRQVADAADDSAWRRAFREAALTVDVPKLKALAGQPEVLTQPPAVLAWLGETLRNRGPNRRLPDLSVAVLRQAQQRHPRDFWINYHLGWTLHLVLGRSDEAVGYCQVAVAVRPGCAEAYSLLGIALRESGDYDAGIAALQQAIALDPKYDIAWDNLVVTLIFKRDWNGTIALCKRLIERDPNKFLWHRDLAYALRRQGKLDEAIAEYRETIRLNKDDADTHRNFGVALSGKDEWDEAIREFREAIRLDDDFGAYLPLGHALMQQGRFADALTAFKQELAKNNWNRDESARWVSDVEQFMALEGKLPKILNGAAQPADNAERLVLARLCQFGNRRYVSATRFYAQAFAAQPERADDLEAGHRYNAARAAALAGCGRGEDAAPLDSQGRARLRQQSLEWLRADLALRAKEAASRHSGYRDVAYEALQDWLEDTDFAGVRGEALAKLPEAERQAWRQLWADVAATLARARGSAAAELKANTK